MGISLQEIGFGPPLLVILLVIALIAFWLWRNERRRKARYKHDRRWIDPDYGRDTDDGDMV